jgi:hypothetical protein
MQRPIVSRLLAPIAAASFALFAASAPAFAQEPGETPDFAAEYDALWAAYEAADGAYMEEMRAYFRAAKEAAESRKAAGETGPAPAISMAPRKDAAGEFAPKFADLAKRAAGTPHATRPLAWLVEYAFFSADAKIGAHDAAADAPPGRAALATLLEKHVDCEEMESLCAVLSRFGGGEAAAEEGLRKILKGAPERRSKAAATAGLARLLYEDDGKQWAPDANGTYVSKDRIPKEAVLARKKEATALFQTLRKDYGETEHAEGAAGYLYEIEHLQIGMAVPDVELVDSEGVAFKLSDYRGKALAIDFWGFW